MKLKIDLELALPTWLKRAFPLLVVPAALLTMIAVVRADVPNLFTDGEVLTADKLNADFNALDKQIKAVDARAVLPPGGRLTLQPGAAVQTSDQLAAASVYYTCYSSPLVPIPNGVGFKSFALPSCQIGMDLGAANVTAGSVYDVFAVDGGGGVPALCHDSRGWTKGNRDLGNVVVHGDLSVDPASLEIHNTLGYWTNLDPLTHCYGGVQPTKDLGPIGADHALYLGSFLATAAGTTAMNVRPPRENGGSNPTCGLYNAYNQVRFQCKSQDLGDLINGESAWTLAGGNSAPCHASGPGGGLNNRINFVDGLAQQAWEASYGVSIVAADPGQGWAVTVALGYDSLDPSGGDGHGAAEEQFGTPPPSSQFGFAIHTSYSPYPEVGKHYVQCLEGGVNTQFYGNDFTMLRLDAWM